jgi:hypothetical protein
VSFASNASNSPTIVNLTGAGSQPGSASLTVTPTALSFGNVAVGSRKSSTVRLINAAPAGSANGTVTQVSVTGNGFNIAPPSVPFTLDPGQSASFTITFAPAAATADSGQLTVTIQGVSQPEIVTLSGIGVASAQLGVNPSTMNFGTVTLGNSQTLSGSLAAAGMDVVINSINLNSQDFVLSGLVFPVTIVAGSKVPFSITFTPQSAGSATAQLAFVSNSLNSAIVDLSGTGAQASQHSVSLSWNASTSQVSGYNVYRSAQSNGTFNKLNSSLIKLLSFTDTNVQSGSTYYYAVTAVDSNNNESPYSNVATAVIP